MFQKGGWPYEISWEITAPGYEDVYVSGACRISTA